MFPRSTALIAILIWPALAAADGNRIEITVEDLRNTAGQLLCSLHNSADAFPGNADKAAQKTTGKIDGKRGQCVFVDVPPGTYAVAVFHDENSNFKLDTNFLGIPKEGVGVSRDAKGWFGPPKFKDASFSYPGGALTLTIRMKYL